MATASPALLCDLRACFGDPGAEAQRLGVPNARIIGGDGQVIERGSIVVYWNVLNAKVDINGGRIIVNTY